MSTAVKASEAWREPGERRSRQSSAALYVHLVWATRDRLPLLDPEIQPDIHDAIRDECAIVDAEVIALGGTLDHIHLLARVPPTLAVDDLAKRVKRASSHLVRGQLTGPKEALIRPAFRWEGCYGAFSVSRWDVLRIREYILRQTEHHRDRDLDEELEQTLIRDSEPAGRPAVRQRAR